MKMFDALKGVVIGLAMLGCSILWGCGMGSLLAMLKLLLNTSLATMPGITMRCIKGPSLKHLRWSVLDCGSHNYLRKRTTNYECRRYGEPPTALHARRH
jgi:hypothetical protein